MDDDEDPLGNAEEVRCPWCGRRVAIIERDGQRTSVRHDNHNNSGFCKGSLIPLHPALGSGSKVED